MKKIVFILLLAGIFNCCSKTNLPNNELIGNWKLIAVLIDPGDGSGTFINVNSSKIITFHHDGTVSSNGDLCYISTDGNNPTSGTYSVADYTISSNNCNNPDYLPSFEQNGLILTINHFCIEACVAKFAKQ